MNINQEVSAALHLLIKAAGSRPDKGDKITIEFDHDKKIIIEYQIDMSDPIGWWIER
jgi:hypothetical protein